MTEHLLFFLYGAIIVSNGFLIGSMTRLSIRHLREHGVKKSFNSTYFWLAVNLSGTSVAVAIICAVRAFVSYHGQPSQEVVAPFLLVGFGLLWLFKIGFNWAGTRDLEHGATIWRSFLATIALWLVIVIMLRA